MDTDTQKDQRRALLDDLLALRHLWPNQVALVQSLAEELGVTVVVMDKSLNGGEWQMRR